MSSLLLQIRVNGTVPSVQAHMEGVHALKVALSEGARRAVQLVGEEVVVELTIDMSRASVHLVYDSGRMPKLPNLLPELQHGHTRGGNKFHPFTDLFSMEIKRARQVRPVS